MPDQKTFRPSLSMQVVLALALGVLTGLVCGELVASFQVIGKGFILLLQMTVLPYVTLSLITGLGRLTYQEVTSLALKVGLLLLITWGLAFAVILVMPIAFPAWESASFFSTTLLEEPPSIDFLSLYIPANPFYSLANSVVPAVVVFSVAIGIALIGMENKRVLLEPLTVMSDALMRVTSLVAKLTPLGVFAIVASAAGTMGLEELGRLEVFLVTYVLIVFLLTFLILPTLITSLTPLTYRQVVGHTRDVLIMAFATGSDLIVLPLLIERCKELLRQIEPERDCRPAVLGTIHAKRPERNPLILLQVNDDEMEVKARLWIQAKQAKIPRTPFRLSINLKKQHSSHRLSRWNNHLLKGDFSEVCIDLLPGFVCDPETFTLGKLRDLLNG